MRLIKLSQITREQQIAALPPIPPDHIRLVHQTTFVDEILRDGLKYAPVSRGLDETVHAVSDMSQFENIKDVAYRVGGENMYTMFFDISIDEHNRHVGRREFAGQMPPGVIPPESFIGMIDPLNNSENDV